MTFKKTILAVTVLSCFCTGLQAHSSYLEFQKGVSLLDNSEQTFESVSQVRFDSLSIDSDETFEKLSK